MSETYSVCFDPQAWNDIIALPRRAQERVFEAIEALEVNPHPSDVKKLKGRYDTYRIRVGGYRVLYEVRDAVLVVLIVKVGNLHEAGKRP